MVKFATCVDNLYLMQNGLSGVGKFVIMDFDVPHGGKVEECREMIAHN